MIDFRYHIVSLISVFLALAVGIVLGAGPLRDSIADELTGQVDQLRAEKETLRTQLDAAQRASQERRTYITEAAPRLLTGTLTDRSVALVELPGADEDVTEAVATRLEQADAAVVGTVTLTDTWVDSAQATFRSGIAQNLVPSMNPAPAADAASDLVLAQALGQALTLRDPDQPATSSAEATQMLELLRTGELITEDSAVDGPAYATVIVGPPAQLEAPTEEELPQLDELNAAFITLATGMSSTGEGSVLAGADDGPGTLLTALRADDAASDAVTTVDSVGTITGQVTVPLAVAAAIAGEGGHFGVSENADAVLPAEEVLPAPDPEQFALGPIEEQG